MSLNVCNLQYYIYTMRNINCNKVKVNIMSTNNLKTYLIRGYSCNFGNLTSRIW